MKRAAAAALLLLGSLIGGLIANEAHNIIIALDDDGRREIFGGFMKRSKEPCGKVTRAFHRGFDTSGTSYWSVACTNGKAFSVAIYNDSLGSTKILDCKVLRQMTKQDCFTKL